MQITKVLIKVKVYFKKVIDTETKQAQYFILLILLWLFQIFIIQGLNPSNPQLILYSNNKHFMFCSLLEDMEDNSYNHWYPLFNVYCIRMTQL